ncbi:unnamed protein product [Gadus morhua 'NCC']
MGGLGGGVLLRLGPAQGRVQEVGGAVGDPAQCHTGLSLAAPGGTPGDPHSCCRDLLPTGAAVRGAAVSRECVEAGGGLLGALEARSSQSNTGLRFCRSLIPPLLSGLRPVLRGRP